MKGKRIRQIRAELGYTQKELGRLVGLSDQMIARYEKEQSEASKSFIRLLALLFEERVRGKVKDVRAFLESCE